LVQVFDAERFWPHVVVVAHSFTSTHVAVAPLPARTKPGPQPHV
jgi:hypothetical protein